MSEQTESIEKKPEKKEETSLNFQNFQLIKVKIGGAGNYQPPKSPVKSVD